jgi:hypothetical protein
MVCFVSLFNPYAFNFESRYTWFSNLISSTPTKLLFTAAGIAQVHVHNSAAVRLERKDDQNSKA